jgi:hypothetical protein
MDSRSLRLAGMYIISDKFIFFEIRFSFLLPSSIVDWQLEIVKQIIVNKAVL